MVTIHSPGARARQGGDPLLDVGDRAHRPERREHLLEALAVHVGMPVDETGQHGPPGQLVDVRAGTDVLGDRFVAAHRQQPVALDRQRLGQRARRILGEHAPAAKDPVGGARGRSGHR
ncbi:MAG: hypothetical protein ACK5WE_10760 [bacterium]